VLRAALKYSVSVQQLDGLELEVNECRSLLQLVLPKAKFVLCFHYLDHIVPTIRLWGPMPFYAMMRFERMMGYLTNAVRRTVDVEPHIVRNFQLRSRVHPVFSAAKVPH
jgi:hypothetical protein